MHIQGMLTTIVPICTNIVQLLEDNAHFQMHVTKSFTFMLFNRQLQCWVIATTNNLLVEIYVKETFERLGFNLSLG
jgi:GDP-D-mannose dehydratase